MSIFKEIAGRVWATWGLLSFIATFLIILPVSLISYLIPEPGGTHFLIRISRVWMRVWLFLIGCPFRVTGKEYFEKGKSYIVTCNHNSLLDIPLSSPFIPGPNKTIAKMSFAKIPLFGLFYAKGSVLVDRNSEKSRRVSFEKMKWVLKTGMHMCIYPEGTRNRTREPLKAFYSGAFKLAHETKVDIIPAIISGTREAVPLHKTFFFLPQKLEIRFLEPISSQGLSAGALREKVFTTMHDHIVNNRTAKK